MAIISWKRQTGMTNGRVILCFWFLVSGTSYCSNSIGAQDLGWTLTQPIASGQIGAISGSVNGTILAGVSTSEFYRSKDDGFTWSRIDIDQSITEPISAVALREDGFAIVGTTFGNVFRSFDSGDSWELMFGNTKIRSLIIDASGSIFIGRTIVVKRSKDSGDSWTSVIGPSDFSIPISWAVSTNSSGLLYAAAVGCLEGSCGVLWRSSDGGDSWDEIVSRFDGEPMSHVVVSDLGYVFVVRDQTPGLFRAIEGEPPTPLSMIAEVGTEVHTVFSSSKSVLVAATSHGVRHSVDNGATWQISGFADMDVKAVSETASGHLLAGTVLGIHRSDAVVVDVEELPEQPGFPARANMARPYPNPTRGEVHLSVSTATPTQVIVEVYSPLGRILLTVSDEMLLPGEKDIVWSMRGFASGTYYCTVTDGEQTQTFPITVVR